MIIHLPDPVAARVQDVAGNCVSFVIRDAAHQDAFLALFEKALKEGYAVEIKLIHYEGTPNMIEQAKARKERQRLRSEKKDDRAVFSMSKTLER